MPRIFCVGRNYVKHAAELGNKVPTRPMIFMKPYSSLIEDSADIPFPTHGKHLHYETELVIQIGKAGKPHNGTEISAYISGIGVGIDLTLRDVQDDLKQQQHPWEIAKSFDSSASVTAITPFDPKHHDLKHFNFIGSINGKQRQHGNTENMIFPVDTLILYIASIWQLEVGDLIYTGTPEGVGEIFVGDTITVGGDFIEQASWKVVTP